MTASDQDQDQLQALELELRETKTELARVARESALVVESLRTSEEFKSRLLACSPPPLRRCLRAPPTARLRRACPPARLRDGAHT